MEMILLVFLGISILYWLDSLSKRERATLLGRELSQRFQLQFLDESIVCSKIRLKRNDRGQVQLLRVYVFDVSANGVDRMQCHLTLLGKHLESWHIPPYLQPIH